MHPSVVAHADVHHYPGRLSVLWAPRDAAFLAFQRENVHAIIFFLFLSSSDLLVPTVAFCDFPDSLHSR